MPTLEQRITQLEAPKAYRNAPRRAELARLIREAKPDPREAQTLSYADLQRMARARQRGEPITTLSTPDADGLLHVVAMRYPTPDGWRDATPDELAEYEAAMLAAQAMY